MFKFDFEDDQTAPVASTSTAAVLPIVPCHDVGLDELLAELPDVISYSSLIVNGSSLLRRDLYDARYQLAQENDAEAYVDADTDLIPGVYEGGLKTWEGGVDLVAVIGDEGGRVLEVGCGTALPTAHLLARALASGAAASFHLQDYNRVVLSLVTLPNLILAALPYLPPEVQVEPGSLSLSPALRAAFADLLVARGITLRFTYGDWSGFSEVVEPAYDLVMTAETIYEARSADALIAVLRRAGAHAKVLVAAKVLYFGVGGDLATFIRRVTETGATVKTVQEWLSGVGRRVVQVDWSRKAVDT